MVPMLGQPQPHKQDRHLPGFLHGDHRPDRSALSDERWFFTEARFRRTLHRFDIGSLKQSFEWMKHPFPFDFHLWIDLGHMALEQRKGLFRSLIWHQPHTHFEFAMARYDCLHPWAVIAADQPM